MKVAEARELLCPFMSFRIKDVSIDCYGVFCMAWKDDGLITDNTNKDTEGFNTGHCKLIDKDE